MPSAALRNEIASHAFVVDIGRQDGTALTVAQPRAMGVARSRDCAWRADVHEATAPNQDG
jgi:hypothetical protein